MQKCIYELTQDYEGRPIKNKYVVVYENKTYFYCKVYGDDELIAVIKSDIDTFIDLYGDKYYYSLEDFNVNDKFEYFGKSKKERDLLQMEDTIKHQEDYLNSLKEKYKKEKGEV